ncbi:MAG: Glycosyl transferase 2 family protein [Parcubacteria group bacterium GW2011_GWA2_46_7]|nr:MAG: Glycosyl transferase 2 family protein [Parcubacteria group bacterium GW2011_GWA2_46_7]
MSPVKFSICIPVLNEEHYIGILLEALSRQTYKNFEVVIADGNSEDKTIEIVKSFKTRLSITVIRTTVRGVSHERNLAAHNSKEEHLLFLDADTKINDDFLEQLVFCLLEHPVDTATCWNKPLSKNLVDKIAFNAYNSLFLSKAVTGTCIYSKRSVFKKIGGFNETMQYGEDNEIINRARKSGYSFTVFKKPIVFFSTRRMEKEGRLKFYARAIFWGGCAYIFGRGPKKARIKYEFGKHI